MKSVTSDQVVLSWTAPTNAGTTDGTTPAILSGYVVKYKIGDSDFTEIDVDGEGVRLATALTDTTATVIGLTPNTPYTFLVVAVHSDNIFGLDADAPICDKTTSVGLAWSTSPEATSYKLYRDDAEIESTTSSYIDTGLTPGTIYAYKVQACSDAGCSEDSQPLEITTSNNKVFKSIVNYGRTPVSLTGYDERSREVFSSYNSRTPLVAKYVKEGGSGNKDGDSFSNAAENLKTVIDGILDVTPDKIYVVLLTGGRYKAGKSIRMKENVAIVGGVDECLDTSDTSTILDGERSYRVFHNMYLDNTALLHGVTVANGYNKGETVESSAKSGGGMYNFYSSPRLTRVTFSGNTADFGGGIINESSSPTLIDVTFSENTAKARGGGMYNVESSPSLVRVTFSKNKAPGYGSGYGGGMYNWKSSPNLIGTTFFRNTANDKGGGMYNDNDGKRGPLVINSIF